MTDPALPDDAAYASVAQRFTAEVYRGIETLAKLGYPAHKFKSLVDRYGAVRAATNLILDRVPSYGLWRLKELGRLDMSVEMWALLPWYEALFDEAVRDQARRKLRLLDVDVDRELRQLIDGRNAGRRSEEAGQEA